MRNSRTDWTLFFRELTYLMRDFPDAKSTDYEAMLSALEGDESSRPGSSTFYEPLTPELREKWLEWIKTWRTSLASSGSVETAYDRMLKTNPKYVLREWMLVDAYSSAANGEEAELFDLYSLIKKPYEEGSTREQEKYYRRAPDEALRAGGTAFMS